MPCTSTSDEHTSRVTYGFTPLQRCLEPTDLGWLRGSNGELNPILTRIPFVPQCVLQFVKCGCRKSMCMGNCSCRIILSSVLNNVYAKLMLKNVKIVLFCIMTFLMIRHWALLYYIISLGSILLSLGLDLVI